MIFRRVAAGLAIVSGWAALEAPAQESLDDPPIPPGRTHYLGREIAKTMSYHGAPWLTRPEREREENTSELLEQLRISPGQWICDLGCGNGYYTLRMARRMDDAEKALAAARDREELEAPRREGKILAVDIQPEMLELLGQRSEQAGLSHRVEQILGTLADPKLPEGQVDLVLLVDVYHEFSHPELMLRALRRCLAPKGELVLAEFRAEDPDVPIKKLHKMSKAQVVKELAANGYRLTRTYDELPWQHLLFFGADPDFEEETQEDGGP